MSKIAVVTDSTTYLPADLVKKYDISIAPQVLIWERKPSKMAWIFNQKSFSPD